MPQPAYDISNPPDGGINGQPAATIDDLQAHLQAHAREHGFAVVRRNGGNYRGHPKKPTRFKICCDRDAIRKAEGFGNRKTGTLKNDCP